MQPTHNQSLETLDRARVMHPNTDLRAFAAGELGDPTIVTAADGLRIRDQKGNEWIDGFASLWCVNVGYDGRFSGTDRYVATDDLAIAQDVHLLEQLLFLDRRRG